MSSLNNCLIVLNYNDSETTIDFVDRIIGFNSIDKIIVVDNASTDNSFNLLKNLENEKTDVIKTDKNGGYAYGNNYGCRCAIKKYNPQFLFISNPDAYFDEKVIKRMQEELQKDDNLGVIAPIVNQGYNVWRKPNYFGVIESVFLVWHNIVKKNIKRKLENSQNEVEYVGVVEGSFWGIKKEAFEKAGGLDEKTFLYYEENIFAKRLEKFGYFEAVLTYERYDHLHATSIRKNVGGKAKAYKYFYTGMSHYLTEYLYCNWIQKAFFNITFAIGYLERLLFDLVNAGRMG